MTHLSCLAVQIRKAEESTGMSKMNEWVKLGSDECVDAQCLISGVGD